jgi:hypothetical protein
MLKLSVFVMFAQILPSVMVKEDLNKNENKIQQQDPKRKRAGGPLGFVVGLLFG